MALHAMPPIYLTGLLFNNGSGVFSPISFDIYLYSTYYTIDQNRRRLPDNLSSSGQGILLGKVLI